ncbi:MAG: DUF1684 domain-containing protein [Dehalococcoidia bacterium]
MSELTDFRAAKDRFFSQNHHSPLLPEQRKHFHHLEYYAENPAMQLVLQLNEFPGAEKEQIEMLTSTGDSRPHIRWGTFTFSVEGESATLTVYKGSGEEDYFLPFADATTGDETYDAGRYLDLEPLGNGDFLLDFNYAYNPYCAYNPQWSCPIPPAENRLKVAIRAGEKRFPGAAH